MDNPKKGRPRKKPLDKQVENDLIAELQKLKEENQYLRAENEYIKKLSVLYYLYPSLDASCFILFAIVSRLYYITGVYFCL